MDVELGGEVAVEHKVEGVLPLHTRPVVVGEGVEPALEGDGRDDLPVESGLQLATEVVLGGLPFFQTEGGFVHLGVAHVAEVVGERRHEDGQVVFLLVELEVHTEADGEVGGGKEGAHQYVAVGFVAVEELGPELGGDGVVPVVHRTDAELVVEAQLVGGEEVLVVFVGRRGGHTYLGFEEVLEEHFLIVVVVGKELEGGETGEVALSSLVPVFRHVVLADLQGAVTAGDPPVGPVDVKVGLSHVGGHLFGLEEVDDTCLGGDFGLDVGTEHVAAHDAVFGGDYQLGCLQVEVHQGAVDLLIGTAALGEDEGVYGQELRGERGGAVGQQGAHGQCGALLDGCVVVGQQGKQPVVIGVGRNVAGGHRGVVEVVELGYILIIQKRHGVHLGTAALQVELEHEVLLQEGGKGVAVHIGLLFLHFGKGSHAEGRSGVGSVGVGHDGIGSQGVTGQLQAVGCSGFAGVGSALDTEGSGQEQPEE